MDPRRRTLLRVTVPDDVALPTERFVEQLMGRKPEERLAFIQERADTAVELDI